MDEIKYKPIGIIHTPFEEKDKTPIQCVFAGDSCGRIEIFPEYAAGLRDLDGFSHLILLYHFHRSEGFSLITKPFLDKDTKGIFAIRYFDRPNPIGLSIVRLESIHDNWLEVSQIDILNNTPLLDIKPFVPEFDFRADAKSGWYKDASEKDKYKK